MDTRMYVMTHKECVTPPGDMYVRLHVGREGKPDLGYVGDNTGENISLKNPNYCELTGLYWVWKNVKCDVVGISHYRRYFVRGDDFLKQDEIERLLESYDIIVPQGNYSAEYGSVRNQFENYHHPEDLTNCRNAIEKLCPEYLRAFDAVCDCGIFYVFNMMIARKEVFDAYCEWLFKILFEVERNTDVSTYDTYNARLYGFLSERLLRVWLFENKYRIREEMVKLIDPAEVYNGKKQIELIRKIVMLTLRNQLEGYKAGNYKPLYVNTSKDIDFHGKIPVWACWWQGLENAPDIVKACLNSVDRNLPEDLCEMHLITLDNVGMYVDFPDWVVDKFNAGKISMTHLSDILRAALLTVYGGMWIDATYFASKPIDRAIFTDMDFYTQKCAVPKWDDMANGRWACNLMKGSAGNLLYRFMLDAFYEYWKVNDSLIAYFLIDFIIDIAYEELPEVHAMIDDLKPNEPNVFELEDLLPKRFSKEVYDRLTADTCFFKLTYKKPAGPVNLVGEQTYQGYIIEHNR